jgi:hypothetical protein
LNAKTDPRTDKGGERMSRITVRIDDLINQLNELKRDGAEKVLLEIEEGVADPEENCPNRINLMSAYNPSEIFLEVYESD